MYGLIQFDKQLKVIYRKFANYFFVPKNLGFNPASIILLDNKTFIAKLSISIISEFAD